MYKYYAYFICMTKLRASHNFLFYKQIVNARVLALLVLASPDEDTTSKIMDEKQTMHSCSLC
jgi:hypothetical protein